MSARVYLWTPNGAIIRRVRIHRRRCASRLNSQVSLRTSSNSSSTKRRHFPYYKESHVLVRSSKTNHSAKAIAKVARAASVPASMPCRVGSASRRNQRSAPARKRHARPRASPTIAPRRLHAEAEMNLPQSHQFSRREPHITSDRPFASPSSYRLPLDSGNSTAMTPSRFHAGRRASLLRGPIAARCCGFFHSLRSCSRRLGMNYYRLSRWPARPDGKTFAGNPELNGTRRLAFRNAAKTLVVPFTRARRGGVLRL